MKKLIYCSQCGAKNHYGQIDGNTRYHCKDCNSILYLYQRLHHQLIPPIHQLQINFLQLPYLFLNQFVFIFQERTPLFHYQQKEISGVVILFQVHNH